MPTAGVSTGRLVRLLIWYYAHRRQKVCRAGHFGCLSILYPVILSPDKIGRMNLPHRRFFDPI